MNVMVLGATGFIGAPLARRLVAEGHAVLAVSRHGGGSETPQVMPLALDRGDAAAVAQAAETHGVEAVIDLLAMTLAATQPLFDALAGRIGRYVMASSGDVYRQYGALHRLEPASDPRATLDEAAPLRTRAHPYRANPRRAADDPAAWMDDYDKIPIEQALAARDDLASVILRLPMVFGPGDRQRRFAWAIRPMLAKAPVVEIDAAWAAWRTTYGFVDDVAAGLALAATHPAAASVYNLGYEDAPDHLGWAARLAQRLEWNGELRPVAREAVRAPLQASLDALDLSAPFVTDSGRIRGELGFREAVPPQEALARAIDDEARRIAS